MLLEQTHKISFNLNVHRNDKPRTQIDVFTYRKLSEERLSSQGQTSRLECHLMVKENEGSINILAQANRSRAIYVAQPVRQISINTSRF